MDKVLWDPALICQAFFILATIAALSANAIPLLRQTLLLYGPRSVPLPSTKTPPKDDDNIFSSISSFADKLQVPHTWFTHYYIVSVVSSCFWAYQITTNGVGFRYLASYYTGNPGTSMTVNQVLIAWIFMAIQGSRRLYECITLFKPSTSKMSIVAWALGIAFYVAAGVSIWVEGIRE